MAQSEYRVNEESEETIDLGVSSVSLGVKDMDKSRQFYEKLGFRAILGDVNDGWLILKTDGIIIGLFTEFQTGPSFLTFNPLDVRGIQKILKKRGCKFSVEADEKSSGPAYAVLYDPDGNKILFDQH